MVIHCASKILDTYDNKLIWKTNYYATKDLIEICSKYNVPYKIFKVKDIPYTLNGKKIEITVKNIINGDEVLNRSSIANPESLKYFENIPI